MLSIITITYNNFEELRATLSSVPESDEIESVVINGGDCKLTRDYLSARGGKFVSGQDSGISDAFNKGIDNSSGKYIMYLNSGDILLNPEYLFRAVKFLEENPELYFTHTNLLFTDSLGVTLQMKPSMKNIGRGMPYFHPGMICRRELFSITGKFNTGYRIAMDYDLAVRIHKHGLKGMYLDLSPAVKMDGSGVSALSEGKAMTECLKSLRDNNCITLPVLFNYMIRKLLYYFRRFLVKSGLSAILVKLKKLKYSDV